MDILDLFYNKVIKEASQGDIDCFLHYNIIFNTFIAEDDLLISGYTNNENVLIPTLYIKNKQKFDCLLIKYVELAKVFYQNTDFDDVRLKDIFESVGNGISKEKLILTLLWLNATYDDFADPISFLEKRIAYFLESQVISDSVIGYSKILKSKIFMEQKKDDIEYETPYRLLFSLENINGRYYLPEVKYGIFNGTIFIYAIQNGSIPLVKNSKEINRCLYKVGEGFNNALTELKDITPSFLLSINLALSYFNSLGFKKIVVSAAFVERWNSAVISIEKSLLSIEERKEYLIKQEGIYQNTTEKLIRTFLRLAYHYDGMDIISYPFEAGSNLTIVIEDLNNCNNQLLAETSILARKKLND